MPGASANLLQEVMVKVSVASEPQLQAGNAAAGTLYRSSDAAALGPGQGQHKAPQGRAVPRMGVLGEFLLGLWQEEVAHEQRLHT